MVNESQHFFLVYTKKSGIEHQMFTGHPLAKSAVVNDSATHE